MDLATAVDGLTLRPLVPANLDAYATLVDANREHLTSRGDYGDLGEATERGPGERPRLRGAGALRRWLGDALIGRVDLIPA